jgi:flagellar basal-body rod modification protein FlgD
VTVRTLEVNGLSAGTNALAWDGKDADGKPAAAGKYSVSVQAYDSEGNAVKASTFATGEVTSVRFRDGQAYLVVDDQEIPIGDVTEITA